MFHLLPLTSTTTTTTTTTIDSETTVKEEGRSEADFHKVDAVLPRLTLPIAREKAPFLWEGYEELEEGEGREEKGEYEK